MENEIPKLEIKQIYWTPRGLDLYNDDSDQYHDFICPDDLQEVNAFYNKYKNNEKLFMRDYPKEYEYYLEYLLLNRCNIHNDLNWYDWLHDYLYKVE